MKNEKQKERLVELLDKAFIECDDNYGRPCTEQVPGYLMSNNVVVLPLKVGDRIYRLDVLNDKIIDWTIVRIDIYEDEVVYCDDSFNLFTEEEFGVRGGVFLTL